MDNITLPKPLVNKVLLATIPIIFHSEERFNDLFKADYVSLNSLRGAICNKFTIEELTESFDSTFNKYEQEYTQPNQAVQDKQNLIQEFLHNPDNQRKAVDLAIIIGHKKGFGKFFNPMNLIKDFKISHDEMKVKIELLEAFALIQREGNQIAIVVTPEQKVLFFTNQLINAGIVCEDLKRKIAFFRSNAVDVSFEGIPTVEDLGFGNKKCFLPKELIENEAFLTVFKRFNPYLDVIAQEDVDIVDLQAQNKQFQLTVHKDENIEEAEVIDSGIEDK